MKDTTKPVMKPLSDLNLLDRFLFACTMEDVGTMELVLQIILDKEIRLYDDVQVEKEVRTAPWLRSIRLDVVTMDECALYNTEVQKKNTGNLSRRSRFYQAVMDSSLLAPGEVNFNKLPDVTLITIAPFDLFGEGKYCYTFRMKCGEAENLYLEDGAVRIFLNTRGTNGGEVREELVNLLRYFEESTEENASRCNSERIQTLHKQVCKIKASEEIGVRYMQEWEEKAYAREEGREEGRKEAILSLVMRKLEKGKSAVQIAEELEMDVSEIEAVIGE